MALITLLDELGNETHENAVNIYLWYIHRIFMPFLWINPQVFHGFDTMKDPWKNIKNTMKIE